MEANLEQALQEGVLRRQLNALIVAYLRGDNLNQAAAVVARATMIPLNTEVSHNRLLELVSKGLAVERDEILKGNSSSTPLDATSGLPSAPALPNVIDFRKVENSFKVYERSCDMEGEHLFITRPLWGDVKGLSKNFSRHETRHVSEHKNIARCARFSPDGLFFATGSSDYSIKLFEVSKIKQMMASDAREGPIRPVIRTFYDHAEPINDLDFHPQGSILISGAKDNTIKFFDFSKAVARKAFRVIQDTHNVRSISFHPSGEFILAGTDHHIPHLYDVNTFQCFLTAKFEDSNNNSAINQIRYSSSGSLYVTASKDGSVVVWDGATAQPVRHIAGAHGLSEATSACFTKDQRFVLSCGKDSTIKLWEVGTGRLVKQYLGAVHTQLRCQATFNETEEFILSIDESNNEVVVWDALSGEKVARWNSNHVSIPRWIEHSPTEAAFATCGTDRSVRYWKEMY